jgi:hypothetical protein
LPIDTKQLSKKKEKGEKEWQAEKVELPCNEGTEEEVHLRAVSSSSFSLLDSSKASNIQCFLSWQYRQCLGQWETSLLLLLV